MKVQLFCSLALALAATAAHAQYSPEYNKCMSRAGSNTVQTGMCAQAELTKQDDRLNKAYTKVMSQLPAGNPQRIALRDDERSWLTKRDYDCKVNRDTIDNGCLAEKTAQRADFFEKKVKF